MAIARGGGGYDDGYWRRGEREVWWGNSWQEEVLLHLHDNLLGDGE
ncbi:hypothetical protein TIFTF001_019916 [Ficus carica]|uniref:Uncharacterized protein n=1 Tax=Ficus carica TaxID=3494 RepID=A0AA88A9R7_FICCA|nr:hypothetical protein TIFTF001_019916 [Ficus carica]